MATKRSMRGLHVSSSQKIAANCAVSTSLCVNARLMIVPLGRSITAMRVPLTRTLQMIHSATVVSFTLYYGKNRGPTERGDCPACGLCTGLDRFHFGIRDHHGHALT